MYCTAVNKNIVIPRTRWRGSCVCTSHTLAVHLAMQQNPTSTNMEKILNGQDKSEKRKKKKSEREGESGEI
jgi:hypothetical protein